MEAEIGAVPHDEPGVPKAISHVSFCTQSCNQRLPPVTGGSQTPTDASPTSASSSFERPVNVLCSQIECRSPIHSTRSVVPRQSD
jgi:hypothetical protein